ncbi:helix-turn-helix domain-containing protein [Streptomyces sp. NBC_00820]|uniref:helix-turn-helix domain-containing protein n=1 Tax=Streptomyces sp. NBC_00820 TaxID=2975842 RepID=UPI002ED35E59|nr:helix-turn-helix domain-containing protein [Streptomyces sp. NBC_00820]
MRGGSDRGDGISDSQALGPRAKELRRAAGMAQSDLAAAMGRSESWVSQVERGVQPGPEAMSRSPQSAAHGQGYASGGGSAGTGWRGRRSRPRVRWGVRGVLPSRTPSTQAEPSRRGPWRPGRSYSGALHLDAMNHARSTVCGSTAYGTGAGEGCWLRKWAAKACRCPLDYHPRAGPPSSR